MGAGGGSGHRESVPKDAPPVHVGGSLTHRKLRPRERSAGFWKQARGSWLPVPPDALPPPSDKPWRALGMHAIPQDQPAILNCSPDQNDIYINTHTLSSCIFET